MSFNLICPLTLIEFVDPVIDPEGNTFERSAITEWLRVHGTSPLTRNPINISQLAPNRAIKDLIEEKRNAAAQAASGIADAGNLAAVQTAGQSAQVGDQGAQTAASALQAASVTQAATHPATGAAHNNNINLFHVAPLIAPQAEVTLVAHTVDHPGACDGRAAGRVLTRIEVGTSPAAHSVHIVAVIDVSGSMGDLATIKNASGETESHGLSLLDVVKHAIVTIANGLRSSDLLSLVTFSGTARVALGPTAMNDAGRTKVARVLATLQPGGSTNLWGGISLGIEQAVAVQPRLDGTRERFSSVYILTDGVPSDTSLDYTGALRRQLDKTPIFGSLSTFGFGYSLDSKLLDAIAAEGEGSFAFIPDAGFVGTIFINAVANLRTVMGVAPRLTIANTGAAAPRVPFAALSSFRVTSPTAKNREARKHHLEASIHLPPLRYANQFTVVFDEDAVPPGTELLLTYETLLGTRTCKCTVADRPVSATHADNSALGPAQGQTETQNHGPIPVQVPTADEVLFQTMRTRFATAAKQTGALRTLKLTPALREALTPTATEEASTDLRIVTLCEDLEGQVAEAISREDWFLRWGKHYLLSIAGAHLAQVCNNFKDASVQHYGGDQLFKETQAELNDIFMNLPPPEPSARAQVTYYGSGVSGSSPSARGTRSRSPIDMSSYNNCTSVCFHGSALVKRMRSDKSYEFASFASIAKGDMVLSASGPSRVLCVTRQTIASGTLALCNVRGVLVTPFHPVLNMAGEWRFPSDLVVPAFVDCNAVYNLVLEDGHVVLAYPADRVTASGKNASPRAVDAGDTADAVFASTLGHDIAGEVIYHPYFGTNKVVADLMTFAGWETGLVEIAGAHRGHDNTVVGLIPA